MTNLQATAARAPGSFRVHAFGSRADKLRVPPRRLTRVCAWCHRVQQPDGSWLRSPGNRMDDAGHRISHGICPECVAALLKQPTLSAG